ncbi:TPA: GNAT family N-acetyltransferase [Candidatus Ventrenecus avicola]|nr:GNAT family N-acetyltransferase [Candidatus Ventrenecus avicola]
MIRMATNSDIEKICELRIFQQKDEWQEEYIDKFDLYNSTKKFLTNHLNKDLYIFINIIDENIVATCGQQVVDLLPQCNDNGKLGYICNVYTVQSNRRQGFQKTLLNEIIKFAKEKRVHKLSLDTDNKDAIMLYKKLKFYFDNLAMKLEL